MKKEPTPIEDIYRSPRKGPPKEMAVAWEPPGDLEHKLRRQLTISCLLGLFCFALFFSLAVLLLRDPPPPPAPPPVIAPEEVQYVPKYTLPSDDLWVMSYQQAATGLSIEGAVKDQPVSTKWVKNVAYHLIVGQQALAVEQYEKAIVHFKKALAIFPEIHGVRGSLGTVYLKQQRYEAAIEQLSEAVHEEESFSAINNLGAALLAAGRFEEAEDYLLQARDLQPNHPGGYKNLALLYQKMDKPEKALPYFEVYFSLYPEDFAAVELYANYLISLNRRERATAFLREACQTQSKEALPLYLLLAKLEAQVTNTAESVEALKNITRYISPNLALTELHHESFDPIRDTEAFENLVHQLELAMVTLENQN